MLEITATSNLEEIYCRCRYQIYQRFLDLYQGGKFTCRLIYRKKTERPREKDVECVIIKQKKELPCYLAVPIAPDSQGYAFSVLKNFTNIKIYLPMLYDCWK